MSDKLRRLFALPILLVLLAVNSNAQVPVSVKPQASVVIKEDPTSAELVEITMVDPKFPEAELRQVVARLGAELGVEPRGFASYVEPYQSAGQPSRFVKSRIGVNGLIDRTRGELNLQALARAFAGIPAPYTVKAFSVLFDDELASPATLSTFASNAVAVDGKITVEPRGIEYLVVLRTQKAAEISIPSKHTPDPVKPVEPPAPAPSFSNVFIGLLVLASVSAGALVYFLVLSRSRPSAKGR